MAKFADRRLKKEIEGIKMRPIVGVEVDIEEGDIHLWHLQIRPPAESAFSGSIIRANILFPVDYPYGCPTVLILTPLHHPNVDDNGQVCLALLRKGSDPASKEYGDNPLENWSAAKTVENVIKAMLSIIYAPDTASCVNLDAADLYDNEFDTYVNINKTLMYSEEEEEEDGDGEEAPGP